MASQTQAQRSAVPLIILLLILLGIGILILPSLKININTGAQSNSDGQCQSAGKSFDEQQEAFTLAQSAEQYRSIKPFNGNYGLGSYTICYKDGSQQRAQSDVFKGGDNTTDPTHPINYTHSEQSSYGWLQNKLSQLSVDKDTITAIYAVIFSQVVVCPPCEQDMKSWQSTLRTKGPTKNVFLSIWDIGYGKGFDPRKYPAGTGTPIALNGLEKISIPFEP